MNLNKRILLALALLLSLPVIAQFKINEIMSNNVSAVWDNAYNYSMWVELYNTNTTTSYNQSAFYFTDDLTQPKKWNPASKLVSPNGFSVLWFERDERSEHANFKLNTEGGKLYLLNSSAVVIDSVVYPKQYRNILRYGNINF